MVEERSVEFLMIPMPDRVERAGIVFNEMSCAVGHLMFHMDFNCQVSNYYMTDYEEDLFVELAKELNLTIPKGGITGPGLRSLHNTCALIEDDDARLIYFSLWCYSHRIQLGLEDQFDVAYQKA